MKLEPAQPGRRALWMWRGREEVVSWVAVRTCVAAEMARAVTRRTEDGRWLERRASQGNKTAVLMQEMGCGWVDGAL